MIVELGKYAPFVLSAYAITFILLVTLIICILRFSTKSKRLLQDAELHKDD